MIKQLICIFPLLTGFACFAQNASPQTVTSQLLQLLIAEVQLEADVFEKSMKAQYDTVMGNFPKYQQRYCSPTIMHGSCSGKKSPI